MKYTSKIYCIYDYVERMKYTSKIYCIYDYIERMKYTSKSIVSMIMLNESKMIML